jgi:hypothetical protein
MVVMDVKPYSQVALEDRFVATAVVVLPLLPLGNQQHI